MSEALADYLSDHRGKWKPRTLAEYTRQVNDILIPALGTTKVADLSREDVATVIRRLSKTPTLANRVLALLSAFCTWAVRAGQPGMRR